MVRCHLSSLDLTLVPSHDKRKLVRDCAAGGVPCSGQRGNAGRVRCCIAGSSVARSGHVDESLLPALILGKTEQTSSSLHFLTNWRGIVKEALMYPYKASMLSDSARHETDDARLDKKQGGRRCAVRLSLVFGFRSGRALVWRDFPFFSFSAWPRIPELRSCVLLNV